MSHDSGQGRNAEGSTRATQEDDWIMGKISRIDLSDKCGYITPDDTSESDASSVKKDVRFELKEVDFWVLEDDTVKFTLDTSQPDNPRVCKIKQLKLANVVKSPQLPTQQTPKTSLPRRSNTTPGSSAAENIQYNHTVSDVVKRETWKQFGTIHRTTTSCGYITPENKPDVVNIYFEFSDIQSGNFDLQVGDEVSYCKERKDLLDHRATDVCPFKLYRADSKVFENYFEYLQSDFNSKLTEGKVVLAIACLPIWKSFGNCQFLRDNAIAMFNVFIIQAAKYDSLTDKVAGVLDALLSTPLCSDLDNSRLYTNYVDRMKEVENSELLDAYLVLRIMARLVPYKIRIIVNLLNPNFLNYELSLDTGLHLLLLHLTKRVAAGRVYDMNLGEMPLVPSVQELISGPLESAAVYRVRSYASAQDYVDTYFRHLRADCFSSLTKGVTDLLNGKLDPKDLNVYTRVQFAGVHIKGSEGGISLGFKIFLQRTVINWDQSSNLLLGNLLCISVTGSLRDNIWATVVNRNLLENHQIVIVDLCSECNTMSDSEAILSLYFTNASTIIVESPTYYRAYQPIFKSLQTMDPDELALKVELVSCRYVGISETISERSKSGKQFATKQTAMSHCLYDWPIDITALSDNQKEVINHCRKHRVAIVQGPPGTGKTLICVKLVELLLSVASLQTSEPNPRSSELNYQEHPMTTPIVIITSNNFSLNQIIKLMLLMSSDEVACIGRSSQKQKISNCNLDTLAQKKPMPPVLFNRVTDLRSELKNLKNKVENSFASLVCKIYFNVETLVEALSHDQLIDFLKNRDMSATSARCSSDAKSEDTGCRDLKNITHRHKVTEILNKCKNIHLEIKLRESGSVLGAQLYSLLEYALKQWLPNRSKFADFERHYSDHNGLSYPTSYSERNFGGNDEESDLQGTLDYGEIDVKELLKERMATMTVYSENTREDILKSIKMLPEFSPEMAKDGLNDFKPRLMKFAKELSEKLPLGILLNANRIWELVDADKIKLVQLLLFRQFEKEWKSFDKTFTEYLKVHCSLEKLKNQHKVDVLLQMKIVCMTIAGAGTHCHLISQLRPKVVIVLDAARIQEPQLIAVVGSWVHHLIMIGDHLQLGPSITNYQLVKNDHMNISMMARLIKSGFPYVSLTTQNRMLPNIASLLLDIYPKLKNNMSLVNKMNQASCLEQSRFFWEHEEPESACGFTNKEEATRAVWLALFLIIHGNAPKSITILSPYFKQVQLICKKVAKAKLEYFSILNIPSCEAFIQVHTVDSYQGWVNDFVVVSLVKSNKSGSVGSVGALNFRCAAQSRSRKGLYFIGNISTIALSKAWKPLLRKLQSDGCVGKTLKLHCPNHPDKCKWFVQEAKSELLTESFCQLICDQPMTCGKHTCMVKCLPRHSHKCCEQEVSGTSSTCGDNQQATNLLN